VVVLDAGGTAVAAVVVDVVATAAVVVAAGEVAAAGEVDTAATGKLFS
jgi:hypothetical protein